MTEDIATQLTAHICRCWESEVRPRSYQHKLLLEGSVADILVLLNVPNRFFVECSDLLLVRGLHGQPEMLDFLSSGISAFEGVVGACEYDAGIEVALYTNNLAESVEKFDAELEVFVTESDDGRFFRSFLLPSDYRNLAASVEMQLDIVKSQGSNTCTIHQLRGTKEAYVQRFVAVVEEVGFAASVSNGSITLRKSCDGVLKSEGLYADLAWIYCEASKLDLTYDSVEFDFRA